MSDGNLSTGATAPQIAKLQDKIERLEQHRLDNIEKQLDEIISRQRDMEKRMERYSARWGFLFMVGSAIVAALKLFWHDIARIFGK